MQKNRKIRQSRVVAGWLTMLCCCSWLAAVGAAQTLDTAKPLRAALNLMDEATVSDLFGKPTSRDFYALHVRIFNNLDRDTDRHLRGKPILVYIDANGQPKYYRHIFRYCAYTFEMMVNSAPKHDSRESKTRKFNVLNGLLSAASIYSFIKPDSGSVRTAGLLSGLVPQLVKSQRPALSDAQRQNFVSMTMKPLEEIPFGADISRVIFFPKSPFRGMLKDRLTRINRIDTSYFNITVAILDKNTATYNAVLSNNRE